MIMQCFKNITNFCKAYNKNNNKKIELIHLQNKNNEENFQEYLLNELASENDFYEKPIDLNYLINSENEYKSKKENMIKKNNLESVKQLNTKLYIKSPIIRYV